MAILTLPVVGFFALRLYESALVRQTESELFAQGAFVATTYRAVFDRVTDSRPPAPHYGLEISAAPQPPESRSRWRPRLATLDLAVDPILPPAPDATEPGAPADRLARHVGSEIAPILQDAQVVTLAGIRVVDPAGTVVASTGTELGLSLRDRQEVRRALTGEYVSLLRERNANDPNPLLSSISRGGRLRVFTASPILHSDRIIGAVVLSRTPASLRQVLYAKRRPLVLGALLILSVTALIAILTSMTINRPIRALIDQARRALRGEQQAMVPLAHPGSRDIDELSQTLAELSRATAARTEYLRKFAAQLSHGLKTPLTALRGAIELLRDHEQTMSEAERKRFLETIDYDTQRLERLVQRLLELARADFSREHGEHSSLAEVLDSLSNRWSRSDLSVEVNLDEAVDLRMAPATLEAIFSNLLENSLQNATSPVTVRVSGSIDAEKPGQYRLLYSDDGPGISATNRQRIFEPFYTTRPTDGGTGMGLAIVDSLLRAHGGSISVRSNDPGACFELILPVQSAP